MVPSLASATYSCRLKPGRNCSPYPKLLGENSLGSFRAQIGFSLTEDRFFFEEQGDTRTASLVVTDGHFQDRRAKWHEHHLTHGFSLWSLVVSGGSNLC